ncbi:MAG: dihydroorotate dehydrogenase electron transfer subunit [Fidelibacterota bacterium]
MNRLILDVLSNENIGKNLFQLCLNHNFKLKSAHPGQFVNIKIDNSFTPLLRRPFSISRIIRNEIIIIYKIVGRGTAILSRKKRGDTVDILGPLGKGFTLPGKDAHYIILAAGGTGTAPLIFLRESLMEEGFNPIFFIGAKSKDELIYSKDFGEAILCTEDGTAGFKGTVIEALFDFHRKNPGTKSIYACGPEEMLRSISKFSLENGYPCQISTENYMGCGTGLCFGCAVKTSTSFLEISDKRYLLACRDGPVFDAQQVEL